MATGSLPRWGDGANPATVKDEVTLDPALFDNAIADRLVAFFGKALAREVPDRFDTAEQMADSWRMIFFQIPEPAQHGPGEVPPLPEPLSRSSAIEAAGLTARALSGLHRLGVATVGELVDYEPSALTRAKGVPDATRKEIQARARELRAELGGPSLPEPSEESLPFGIEAVSAVLVPSTRSRDHAPLSMLLGQAPTPDNVYLHWLAQTEAAVAIGQTQPQISNLVRKYAKIWLDESALTAVRDEIAALLDSRGLVMSAEEIAEALIASRGSWTSGPKRIAQAIGLVRAAVEAELLRGGDARVAIHRFRTSDTVLVGREPVDPSSLTTAADLLAYAVQLGKVAAELAGQERLPTRQRAVEQLRAVQQEGMPTLSDQRLLQLAAAATHGVADVNAQGQLYPVGMPAERALTLAVGSLVGQRLTVEALRDRVRARYPLAAPLPGRPALDKLLLDHQVPLSWNSAGGQYLPPTANIPYTSTRRTGTAMPLTGPEAVSEADAKLAAVVERRGYLAVLADWRRYPQARRTMLERLRLTEVDVTALLIDRLRAAGYPWQAVVEADNGTPGDDDFRALVEMVRHDVVPAIEDALTTEQPVLITEAAPLARYGQTQLLQRLADPTRPRPGARLLLVAARRLEPALLDDVQIPLTSPVSQSLWLPASWIGPVVERTAR
jgi:hypothetical protein